MKFLCEFKSFRYNVNDVILIEYWATGDITPVKIIEKIGTKFKITHNISQSKIFNAPDEIIKSTDIIDLFKL